MKKLLIVPFIFSSCVVHIHHECDCSFKPGVYVTASGCFSGNVENIKIVSGSSSWIVDSITPNGTILAH